MVGVNLLSRIEQYCLASILPSTMATFPTPAQVMQPQTMMLPLPNLTVSWQRRSESPSDFETHTQFWPSEPIRFILVSSDQITRFQSSTVQFWCSRAHLSRARRCFRVRRLLDRPDGAPAGLSEGPLHRSGGDRVGPSPVEHPADFGSTFGLVPGDQSDCQAPISIG